MNIFFVTVLHRAGKRRRCWGWYLKFEDAEKVVLENQTDIFELGYYDMAVIEEYPEGLLAIPENSWWYSYSCSLAGRNETIERVPKPAEYEQVECFAIG